MTDNLVHLHSPMEIERKAPSLLRQISNSGYDISDFGFRKELKGYDVEIIVSSRPGDTHWEVCRLSTKTTLSHGYGSSLDNAFKQAEYAAELETFAPSI